MGTDDLIRIVEDQEMYMINGGMKKLSCFCVLWYKVDEV